MTDPEKLKAYMCFNGDPYFDGCVLVFAQNRNKARAMVVGEMGDYVEISARRLPAYDDTPPVTARAIWTNDELPEGAEKFYWPDALEGV